MKISAVQEELPVDSSKEAKFVCQKWNTQSLNCHVMPNGDEYQKSIQ